MYICIYLGLCTLTHDNNERKMGHDIEREKCEVHGSDWREETEGRICQNYDLKKYNGIEISFFCSFTFFFVKFAFHTYIWDVF